MAWVRPTLEVLKWMEAVDILRSAAVTCVLWSRAASNRELWQSLCEGAGLQGANDKDYYCACACKRLVWGQGNVVCLFNAFNSSTREVQLPADPGFRASSAWCLISPTMLVLFSSSPSREVLQVNLRERNFRTVSLMNQRHEYPGVLRQGHWVYVFAGKTTCIEKYHAQQSKVRTLDTCTFEEMWGVTPCAHKDRAYLAGVNKIEAFQLSTETMERTPLKLPKSWYFSLLLIREDSLIALQKDTATWWSLEGQITKMGQKHIGRHGDGYYSNCPPIWHDGKCFSLHNDIPEIFGVFQFDSDEVELRTIQTFSPYIS